MQYRNPNFNKSDDPDAIFEELKKVGVLPDNYDELSNSDDSSD